jgi:hypothetical protein
MGWARAGRAAGGALRRLAPLLRPAAGLPPPRALAAALPLPRSTAAASLLRGFAAAAPPPPAPVPLSRMSDSFADGASAAYLDEIEARFRENPASVDKTWANFFRVLGAPLDAMRGCMRRDSGVHGAAEQQPTKRVYSCGADARFARRRRGGTARGCRLRLRGLPPRRCARRGAAGAAGRRAGRRHNGSHPKEHALAAARARISGALAAWKPARRVADTLLCLPPRFAALQRGACAATRR